MLILYTTLLAHIPISHACRKQSINKGGEEEEEEEEDSNSER